MVLVPVTLLTGALAERSGVPGLLGVVPRSPWYRASGDLPSDAGSVHDRLTRASPGVAVRPVGPPGAPDAAVPEPLDVEVVADAEADAEGAAATGDAEASPESFPCRLASLTAATLK